MRVPPPGWKSATPERRKDRLPFRRLVRKSGLVQDCRRRCRACARHGLPVAQEIAVPVPYGQILGRTGYMVCRDARASVTKREDQRVVAKRIDQPRNPVRISHQRQNGFCGKRRRLRSSRLCPAESDVLLDFRRLQRSDAKAHRYALLELTKVAPVEGCVQFILAGENYLQKLLIRPLKIP